MAKVIELSRYRTAISILGVTFPQIFRIEGYYWKTKGGKLQSSGKKGPPRYTLSDRDSAGYADATWTPITCFDPEIDAGCIIVRHHPLRESVEGYLDALHDVGPGEEGSWPVVFRTNTRIFTLLHQNAAEVVPDNLIMYITKTPILDGLAAGELQDELRCVHPDGTVTNSLDELFYPDED